MTTLETTQEPPQANGESNNLPIIQSKVFTTHRKKPKTTIDICRKGSIVKERCRQLTEEANRLFSSGIIYDDDLVTMIEEFIGADKETIRAYKGYSGHIRAGRCGDNRIVGLSRKGYLEKFGFLRRIPGRKWQVCQLKLLSQDKTIKAQGPKNDTNEKISISTTQGERARENRFEKVVSLCSRKRKEEEDTEKERNFAPMICPKILENRGRGIKGLAGGEIVE